MGNDSTEQRAIRVVMSLLKRKGNHPKLLENGKGADIVCDDGKIEVKGRKWEGSPHTFFSEEQIKRLDYAYVVKNTRYKGKEIVYCIPKKKLKDLCESFMSYKLTLGHKLDKYKISGK